jgi:hypothetical protein
MICLQQKTRAYQEHYKEKRKGANKISKQKINYGLTTQNNANRQINKRKERKKFFE